MFGDKHGFTLIEVLVALVMGSLLLAVVVDGADSAARARKASLDRADAIRLGSSVLARAVASAAPAVTNEGAEAGLHWTLAQEAIQRDPRGIYELVQLRVQVFDERNRLLQTFTTRKLWKTAL